MAGAPECVLPRAGGGFQRDVVATRVVYARARALLQESSDADELHPSFKFKSVAGKVNKAVRESNLLRFTGSAFAGSAFSEAANLLPKKPVLSVRVVSAKGLSEPRQVYCTVEVLGCRGSCFQTPVVQSSCDPVWNHKTELGHWEPGQGVLFCVRSGAWKGDIIGSVLLPATAFMKEPFEGDLEIGQAVLTVVVGVTRRPLAAACGTLSVRVVSGSHWHFLPAGDRLGSPGYMVKLKYLNEEHTTAWAKRVRHPTWNANGKNNTAKFYTDTLDVDSKIKLEVHGHQFSGKAELMATAELDARTVEANYKHEVCVDLSVPKDSAPLPQGVGGRVAKSKGRQPPQLLLEINFEPEVDYFLTCSDAYEQAVDWYDIMKLMSLESEKPRANLTREARREFLRKLKATAEVFKALLRRSESIDQVVLDTFVSALQGSVLDADEEDLKLLEDLRSEMKSVQESISRPASRPASAASSMSMGRLASTRSARQAVLRNTRQPPPESPARKSTLRMAPLVFFSEDAPEARKSLTAARRTLTERKSLAVRATLTARKSLAELREERKSVAMSKALSRRQNTVTFQESEEVTFSSFNSEGDDSEDTGDDVTGDDVEEEDENGDEVERPARYTLVLARARMLTSGMQRQATTKDVNSGADRRVTIARTQAMKVASLDVEIVLDDASPSQIITRSKTLDLLAASRRFTASTAPMRYKRPGPPELHPASQDVTPGTTPESRGRSKTLEFHTASKDVTPGTTPEPRGRSKTLTIQAASPGVTCSKTPVPSGRSRTLTLHAVTAPTSPASFERWKRSKTLKTDAASQNLAASFGRSRTLTLHAASQNVTVPVCFDRRSRPQLTPSPPSSQACADEDESHDDNNEDDRDHDFEEVSSDEGRGRSPATLEALQDDLSADQAIHDLIEELDQGSNPAEVEEVALHTEMLLESNHVEVDRLLEKLRSTEQAMLNVLPAHSQLSEVWNKMDFAGTMQKNLMAKLDQARTKFGESMERVQVGTKGELMSKLQNLNSTLRRRALQQMGAGKQQDAAQLSSSPRQEEARCTLAALDGDVQTSPKITVGIWPEMLQEGDLDEEARLLSRGPFRNGFWDRSCCGSPVDLLAKSRVRTATTGTLLRLKKGMSGWIHVTDAKDLLDKAGQSKYDEAMWKATSPTFSRLASPLPSPCEGGRGTPAATLRRPATSAAAFASRALEAVAVGETASTRDQRAVLLRARQALPRLREPAGRIRQRAEDAVQSRAATS